MPEPSPALTDTIEARANAATRPLPDEARMGAYYYSFNPTGCGAVDAILSAVAIAGKGSHHTDGWGEPSDHGYYDGRPGLPANPIGWNEKIRDDGGSALSLIALTALRSAEQIETLSVDVHTLIAEVSSLRAAIAAADAIHRPHEHTDVCDSRPWAPCDMDEICRHDGETWPCPTHTALHPDEEPEHA